jgi:hypothetical protein
MVSHEFGQRLHSAFTHVKVNKMNLTIHDAEHFSAISGFNVKDLFVVFWCAS